VAYALDRYGEHAAAGRFHAWAARVVLGRAGVVQRALAKASAGEILRQEDVLHTRYTLQGEDGTQEEWANFQLDGFGTWLWALNEHRKAGNPLPPEWLEAARLVALYLAGLWRLPNYDLWEEFPDAIHPHTLAAIYGGLAAYRELAPHSAGLPLEEIRTFITDRFIFDGHFVKFPGSPAVDASLLSLALPYGVVALEDDRMAATVDEIKRSLRHGGGVHRYAADSYYGGGEWVLLAAWLGWFSARRGAPGDRQCALDLLAWIEAQAGPDGSLPEQVPATLNAPAYYETWVRRWGPIASPLLWSHANYLILKAEL
jgi:GH15 family glucan-1,4-alpha-glucosidase